MFTSLNNDILQCILYEWLSVKDICQLDIAVCNHSLRQLYYEALQLSTLSIIKNNYVSEKCFFELIQWSKKRGIKNPIEEINISNRGSLLSNESYYKLSNNLEQLQYTKSLEFGYWNPLIVSIFFSLKNLKALYMENMNIPKNDISWVGLLLKQLACLDTIKFGCYEINDKFDPILLMYISEIPSLKCLYIELSEEQTSDFTRYLSKLTQLESFALSFDSSYYHSNKMDLSCLSSFSRLNILSIFNVKCSIKDILELLYLEELELGSMDIDPIDYSNTNYDNYLPLKKLKSFSFDSDSFDYDFMQYIFQSKQLTSFHIQSTSLKPSLLYGIYQLSSLTSLDIEKIDIDEQFFNSLCELSQLQRLRIYGRKESQQNIENTFLPFSKLTKQLRNLNILYHSFVNDNIILEISQLTSLNELSFNWNLDSLEELQPLSNLKQLKYLSIISKNKILSNEKIMILKDMLQLPKLKI